MFTKRELRLMFGIVYDARIKIPFRKKKYSELCKISDKLECEVKNLHIQNVNNRLIDKVTTTNLDLAFRMVGITFDLNTVDKIIDLVELIESKGDDTSIADICKLQSDWKNGSGL